ncbi:MAG TPA: aquaporin [Mycobacteriales bacterium]|nr:aquaporin [Mycobacteriales bacterium]
MDHPPAAPQPAHGGWHGREWLAEAAGTALLLLGGLSAVSLDFGAGSPVPRGIPSPSLRLLLTGLLFAGSGSLVAISPIGRLSGAHLNPAVTLSFWLQGKVSAADLGGYLAGQLTGAIGGVALDRWLWGGTFTRAPVNWGRTVPRHGLQLAAAAGIELGMTAALILTIYAFLSRARTARWTPVATWVLIACFVWQLAPYTGSSLNPVRSLAPDLLSARYPDWWIYLVAPLAGAGVATGLWALVRSRHTLTTKMFHDPRFRSVMATSLPARPVVGGGRHDGAAPDPG